jgi:hypothetical protein
VIARSIAFDSQDVSSRLVAIYDSEVDKESSATDLGMDGVTRCLKVASNLFFEV